RLLASLANERLYRTGYLSLTRGDGGQNLIGDEQGIDLGLIRTQELLAARRVDGAEQFFSTAYDFGFSKSPEEALRIWNHDKILAEVVWVIRQFQPDVIITRFPTTGEGGHGHHTASAILAGEAFEAAADPNRFTEQFKLGVKPWQAKRLLWNTFNFGSTNTQKDDQFKLNVGQYNPLLGKSYGEIAAISRSQHKSQGFGVPAQRGNQLEYFATIKGAAPQSDLMEGIDAKWSRINLPDIHEQVSMIVRDYDLQHPEQSVPALFDLYQQLSGLTSDNWVLRKQKEVAELILACSGFYAEAVTDRQLNVVGDSLRVTVTANKRLPADWQIKQFSLMGQDWKPDSLRLNENSSKRMVIYIPATTPLSQPYWLEQGLSNG
ncbi:MAG TPA: PIG-L family deacetylase, partial [Ferruginibacter sp.]|nr:PIG-L family deacetylase [Ferruginibacter sp.]